MRPARHSFHVPSGPQNPEGQAVGRGLGRAVIISFYPCQNRRQGTVGRPDKPDPALLLPVFALERRRFLADESAGSPSLRRRRRHKRRDEVDLGDSLSLLPHPSNLGLCEKGVRTCVWIVHR